MIFGAWVVLFLFLGFPRGWDKAFAVISGVIIVGVAYKLPQKKASVPTDLPYIEHKTQPRPAEITKVGMDDITRANHL